MPQITRRFEFDYGHRILNHEGRCRAYHGHRGSVEITCQSSELDELGRVIDFGVLKGIVGKWIDYNLDHNMILHPDDPIFEIDAPGLCGRDPFIMPSSYPNPTAENIARLLFHVSVELLKDFAGIQVTRIVFYETPNSWAEYSDANQYPASREG